jgi:hypothetical protein
MQPIPEMQIPRNTAVSNAGQPDNDHWLFAPGMQLVEGQTYRITFGFQSLTGGTTANERVSFRMGLSMTTTRAGVLPIDVWTAPTRPTFPITWSAPTNFPNIEVFYTHRAPTDIYHFGFHCTTTSFSPGTNQIHRIRTLAIVPVDGTITENFELNPLERGWTAVAETGSPARQYAAPTWTAAGLKDSIPGSLLCQRNATGAANNAWAFLPSLTLREGFAYKVTFDYQAIAEGSTVNLKLALSTSTDPNDVEETVWTASTTPTGTNFTSVDLTYTHTGNDGVFHFGFHESSPAHAESSTRIQNLRILAVPLHHARFETSNFWYSNIPTTQMPMPTVTLFNDGVLEQEITVTARLNGTQVFTTKVTVNGYSNLVVPMSTTARPVLGENTLVLEF